MGSSRNIERLSLIFTQVSVAEDKQLNFTFNVEKHITDLLKDLKNFEVISETVYKGLKPRAFRFGVLHGLCKVRQQSTDNCPPFRPIMSEIKTPTYNLAKVLVPFLEPVTTNMYTAKNGFGFAKEIADKDPEVFMASLDIESLFTNIPIGETTSVCCDSLFSNDVKVSNINRIDFEKLLRTALQNNFFNFEGKFINKLRELLWDLL